MGSSHVPVPPQLLEGGFAFLVLRPARPLRRPRAAQFLYDLSHSAGLRLDGERARVTANAPVPRPLVVREIEWDDGDALALDILPDIQLRPVQQGVNADMCPWLKVRLELVPQLRRLVLEVPFHILVARAEIAFLGPRWFLVAADADNHAGEVVLQQHGLERVLLQRAAALDAGRLAVGKGAAAPERLIVPAYDELELPFPAELVAVLDHARDLETRIDVHQRKGHVPEKGLAGQPQQHRRVLANAPQHRQALKLVERLPQDIDALALEFVQEHNETCYAASGGDRRTRIHSYIFHARPGPKMEYRPVWRKPRLADDALQGHVAENPQ